MGNGVSVQRRDLHAAQFLVLPRRFCAHRGAHQIRRDGYLRYDTAFAAVPHQLPADDGVAHLLQYLDPRHADLLRSQGGYCVHTAEHPDVHCDDDKRHVHHGGGHAGRVLDRVLHRGYLERHRDDRRDRAQIYDLSDFDLRQDRVLPSDLCNPARLYLLLSGGVSFGQGRKRDVFAVSRGFDTGIRGRILRARTPSLALGPEKL